MKTSQLNLLESGADFMRGVMSWSGAFVLSARATAVATAKAVFRIVCICSTLHGSQNGACAQQLVELAYTDTSILLAARVAHCTLYSLR